MYSTSLLQNKKAFTLIEMLIVIVIIGILAAALVPRLQSVQGRARDSKRKVDLRSIYNANEIFRTDNGRYAYLCSATGCSSSLGSHLSQPWIVELSGVVTSLPTDPINNGRPSWITGNYSYYYGDYVTGLMTYDMATQLENRTDPDRCEVKQYLYSDPTTGVLFPRCGGTGWSAGHPNSKYLYDFSPDSKSF